MTKFGDLVTPDRLYDELPFAVSINAQLNTNQSAGWNLYNYTMPFTGSLGVTCDVGMSWPVTQNMQGMVGIIENASQSFGFDVSENGLDGRAPMLVGRALGYWPSLGAGTVVAINLRITLSIFATIIRIDTASGFMRACKG